MARGNARLAALLGAAFALSAPSAGAFCRTTTCDAGGVAGCTLDSQGCSTSGIPLFWPEQCLSFSVQADGSPKRGIRWQEADTVIQTAFRQWISVKCNGGAHPSFQVYDFDTVRGPVSCNEPEYNKLTGNANVWMFRDNDWPYEGVNYTLALTTVTFATKSGQILDADVELNSFATPLSTEKGSGADLQSIATHEAGHFLGLAHSSDSTATMFASYSPGDLSFRSLSPDDAAGICEVYPPDRTASACNPDPAHGFSKDCGGGSGQTSSGVSSTSQSSTSCAMRPHGASGSAGLLWLVAAGVGLARRRRQAR